MKNNSDFLQETEVSNDDTDLTAYASTNIEYNDKTDISIEEEQDSVEYQELLRVDVKHISKNKTKIWRPIYEVIHAPFFEETNCF